MKTTMTPIEIAREQADVAGQNRGEFSVQAALTSIAFALIAIHDKLADVVNSEDGFVYTRAVKLDYE